MNTMGKIRTVGIRQPKCRTKLFAITMCSSVFLAAVGFFVFVAKSSEIEEEKHYSGEFKWQKFQIDLFQLAIEDSCVTIVVNIEKVIEILLKTSTNKLLSFVINNSPLLITQIKISHRWCVSWFSFKFIRVFFKTNYDKQNFIKRNYHN